MTAEQFIEQLKAECEHNIRILEKRRTNPSNDIYDNGYIDGRLRWDKDALEKIKEWEKQK